MSMTASGIRAEVGVTLVKGNTTLVKPYNAHAGKNQPTEKD